MDFSTKNAVDATLDDTLHIVGKHLDNATMMQVYGTGDDIMGVNLTIMHAVEDAIDELIYR